VSPRRGASASTSTSASASASSRARGKQPVGSGTDLHEVGGGSDEDAAPPASASAPVSSRAPVTRNREVTKLLDGIIIKEFEEQGLSEGKAKEQLKKIKKSPEKYERKLQEVKRRQGKQKRTSAQEAESSMARVMTHSENVGSDVDMDDNEEAAAAAAQHGNSNKIRCPICRRVSTRKSTPRHVYGASFSGGCPICSSAFGDGQEAAAVVLPCGHPFCFGCYPRIPALSGL